MIVILIVLAITLFGILKYRSLFKGYENVEAMFPGPAPLPFLGNSLECAGQANFMYQLGLRHMSLYRRCYRMWLGPLLYICLITPEEVEVLVNNTIHIKKSIIYNSLIPWVGRGLLTSDGQKWKTHRKALTPAFHFKILESFLEIFIENSKIFCDKLEEKQKLVSFDISQEVKLYALDNICETSMGTSISAQTNPHSEYVQSIKAMLNITFIRCVRPWLVPNIIFRMTKYAGIQKRALTYLHGFSMNVIQQRIKEREEDSLSGNTKLEDSDVGAKKRKVFLDILLDAFDEGIMTVDEVREQVDTFMFEGHDTVTSAISFALFSLAEHPEYQDKVYKELTEIFGDDERAPTTEDLSKMKYMEMVLKETLRCYPSVPVFGRVAEEDLVVDKTTVIPKGAQIVIFSTCVHRNPRHWERPDEFFPDHFLPDAVAKRHPYAHIPFSAGPRNCIGLKFAMLEMKTTLAQVLRKFKLVLPTPKIEPVLSVEVILQSETGLIVALEKRKPLK